MGKKRILTIGFELASDDIGYEDFRSKASLLDWDIVLFNPEIYEFVEYGDSFQGKPSLSDSASFQLKECCEHWRREIRQAYESGKTVIVFLAPLKEVFIDTGQRTYSGTGRNQKTTRHVAQYDNYQAIPAELSPVASSGHSIKLFSPRSKVLAPYWDEFGAHSRYEVILDGKDVPACLATTTGNKAVGAMYTSKVSDGSLLLLPNIDFEPDEFTKEQDDEVVWTSAANKFAKRLLSSIVALDKALRAEGEVTPEPTWASADEFVLGTEKTLRTRLLKAEKRVEVAQKTKEQISAELRSAGAFRDLLYEKGKRLERAILEALRLMGFRAESYTDSDSEFDVVFESSEGRLIGEAEGKDNKSINVDKLRQLSMNIHEDLQRASVVEPAKPVLFGNPFRLKNPDERGTAFTEKCQKAAVVSSTALVTTADLFIPVQYLLSNDNAEYARLCREALLMSTGEVTFPKPPVVAGSDQVMQDEVGSDV